MEIVAAIVGGVMNCLCTPNCVNVEVVKQCKYIVSPTKELVEFRERKGELIALETDIKKRLLVAEEKQGMMCTSVLRNWLNNVKDVVVEIEVIEQEAKATKRCLNNVLPDCCSRSNVGKRISKSILEMTELIEKGGRFSDESLVSLVSEMGMKLPSTRLVGENTAHKMVWGCLLNDEIRTIGVYGMSGVGKTAIMRDINNLLLKEHQHFDKVIWVTVSKDADISKLQDNIATALNLDLSSEQDEAKRTGLLLKALKQRKRFVLILDNMSQAFFLHEIGIPEPSKDNGCKLVLTTRSFGVCKMMGCQENSIKVECLSKDEAWELLIDKVSMILAPEVEKIARDVVEECACLPLAISTIGGKMRGNDDIREWRVALNDLRFSSNRVTDTKGSFLNI